MNLTVESGLTIEQIIQQAEQLVDRRNPNALPLAEKAMAMAIESGNSHYYAHAKYILAFYQCLVANNYDESIELCNEALSRRSEEHTSELQSRGLISYA